MARKTFFSFHYERDAWRAGVVRNCNLIASDDEFGFVDSAAWEAIKRQGDAAIENWIKEQLKHTSVTAVLIGAETAERDWVDYEIRESWTRGNGLVGVQIHNIKDSQQKTDVPGPSPFDQIILADGTALSRLVKTYDFVSDDGRGNMGSWIEDAYQTRKKYTGEQTLRAAAGSPSIFAGAGAPSIITAPAKPWAS